MPIFCDAARRRDFDTCATPVNATPHQRAPLPRLPTHAALSLGDRPSMAIIPASLLPRRVDDLLRDGSGVFDADAMAALAIFALDARWMAVKMMPPSAL